MQNSKNTAQRIVELRNRRGQLRSEAAGIATNEDLLRQFARIEALQEQEPWFAGIQGRIGELEAEIARLEGEFAGLRRQLDLNGEAMAFAANLSPRSFATLRSPAKNLRRAGEKLDQVRSEAKTAQDTSDSLVAEVTAALSARNENNLHQAMDKAGQKVSQYRRRLQIDERLDQLDRHQEDLTEENHRAVERQLLPTWVLAGLGAVFTFGMLLMFTGLVVLRLISGSTDWLTTVLGIVGVAATIIGKIALEKSNARRLDASDKQLALVQGQIKQLEEERGALDGLLPSGGGPLAVRLATAEKELAELEALVPLETRRNAAVQSAAAAGERMEQAEEEFKSARRKWHEALAAAGLPAELSARQVRQLAGQWSGFSENQRRLIQCREELDRRRKEADSLAARVVQVASDAKVTLPEAGPLERLRHLVETLAEQQAAAARRETVRGQLKQLRQLRARHEEAVGRLNHRRRSLFFEAGAEDEDSFRQKAVQSARGEELRRERETLDRDIAAAIGKQCTEEAIREMLEGAPAADLESRGNLLHDRLAMLNSQAGERLEKRGQLNAQIQALADDRRLPRLQMDLAAVQRQIAAALQRWQVLAVLCRVLEDIRASYERDRQPETLKEASVYLARLTQGRYRRVWTPLGEKTLRVDDAGGQSLPVESLSRGTREQLFLSLRLALAASYARRGAALPMVLDDVLVNFDADRAVAAAEVLRDFAAAGHQLLVFTCHEHIAKIFARLESPLSCLPSAFQPGGAVIAFDRAAPAEEPKRDKSPPARRKSAAKIRKTKDVSPSDTEDLSDEEPGPLPASRMPSPSPPPPPKRSSPMPKKIAKSGVFDVDFFDNEEKPGDNPEELEAFEEERSLWRDGDDPREGDENGETERSEGDDDREFFAGGNGELK